MIDDENDDRHHDRLEQGRQGAGHVACDGPGPGLTLQGGGLRLDPRDAVLHHSHEEVVEIGEVPVQAVQALPYLLTVILLAGFIGRSVAPKALAIPYLKER